MLFTHATESGTLAHARVPFSIAASNSASSYDGPLRLKGISRTLRRIHFSIKVANITKREIASFFFQSSSAPNLQTFFVRPDGSFIVRSFQMQQHSPQRINFRVHYNITAARNVGAFKPNHRTAQFKV